MNKDDINSMVSHGLLGLLLGGSAAAAHSLMSEDTDQDEEEQNKGIITVPLSRRHFLKSVRSSKDVNKLISNKGKSSSTPSSKSSISSVSDADLIRLKRELLKKRIKKEAEAPQSISVVTGPETSTFVTGSNTSVARDELGRFKSMKPMSKSAFLGITPSLDKINAHTHDLALMTASIMFGSAGFKMLMDKIKVNRKKRELERSRSIYAKMINNEVNDVDIPYYSKSASVTANHRSPLERLLGTGQYIGWGTAALASLVVYRIMENRRKQLESDADKDNSKYPNDKTIEYKMV